MANYAKFELEDGTVVYIETTDAPKGSSGLIPSRGAAETLEQAGHSFDQAISGVIKMASSFMDKFHTGFVEPPSDVSISFGLKASAELGSMVVARTGVEANYSVSLRWHKEEPKKKGEDGEGDTEKGTEEKK
jgi:hypothetical protein